MMNIKASTLLEDVTRIQYLNEFIQPLNEVALRTFLNREGLTYLYGTGRGAHTVVAKVNNKYSVLHMKANKIVNPSSADNTDTKTQFNVWVQIAINEKIMKPKLSTRDLDTPKFLEWMVNKLGFHLVDIEVLWPELKSVKQNNIINVGNFEIVYQTMKDGEQIKEIMVEVCKILSKHKLSKLCYGKVISTKNLRANNTLADYMPANDVIRISNKSRKSKTVIRDMIHELGHRLMHKYLSGSQKNVIKDKYQEVMGKGSDFKVSVGDKFRDDDGVTFEIDGVKISRGVVWYRYKKGDNRYKAKKEGLMGFKRLNKPSYSKDPFEVSAYARINSNEFFCEVLSYAIVGNDKVLLDWIKQFT